MLSCCCCSRNTTSTTTLRAYFCENKGRICLLREPNTATHHTKNLHSKHTNRRRSNVRRCELRRVLENRRDVVLEVRQRVRRNRSRRAQGAALVQGRVLLLSLLSLSVRESIDPFSSSRSKLSLLTIFSLFHKRLERGTRCTLKRRNT